MEKEILAWARCQGWDLDVIDAKATYSVKAKAFRKSTVAPEGFSDLVGCTDSGRAVFLELKARGVRRIRVKQRAFLMRKIMKGCIAGPVRCQAEVLALSIMNRDEMLEWLKSFTVDFS